MHLPDVGMRELIELQIDDNEAAQFAVEEEQIDTIPFVINAEPPLPADKCEMAAEFQEE